MFVFSSSFLLLSSSVMFVVRDFKKRTMACADQVNRRGARKNQPLPDRSKQGNRGAGWLNLFSICIYVSPSKCAYCSIDGNHRDFVGLSVDKGSTCNLLSRSYCGSADYIFVHCVLAGRTVSMVNTHRTHHFCIFLWCLYRTRGSICQYILLYGLQNHSVNLEESLAFDEVTLSTIASHILLSLFLSFVVAALFEEDMQTVDGRFVDVLQPYLPEVSQNEKNITRIIISTTSGTLPTVPTQPQ